MALASCLVDTNVLLRITRRSDPECMGAPERFQGLPRRPNTALLYIFKSLTDSLRGIGLRGDVEEPLIGVGLRIEGAS